MSDLIDRQAAIKDAESWVAVDEYEKHLQKKVVEWLKELPPAQPEQLGTNLAEVGTDCISRQAAIDVVKGIDRSFVKYIEELPPAQPERIRGRWIEHDDGLVACECSVCHEKYNLYEEDVFGRNFCPNCGAEMEVTT